MLCSLAKSDRLQASMQQQVDKTDKLIQQGQAMSNVMHGGKVEGPMDKHKGGQEKLQGDQKDN